MFPISYMSTKQRNVLFIHSLSFTRNLLYHTYKVPPIYLSIHTHSNFRTLVLQPGLIIIGGLLTHSNGSMLYRRKSNKNIMNPPVHVLTVDPGSIAYIKTPDIII